MPRDRNYFEANNQLIGIMIIIGSIYPLGKYWYFGTMLGVFVFGLGWRESYQAHQRNSNAKVYRIAGPILLIILIANIAKLFLE